MWRLYLHDWAGAALGELTDVRSLKLNVGLNKTATLTFDTSLASPTGKTLADRDYSIITAYRWDPFTSTWSLQFSGPVFSTEENGAEGITTIGVSAIGAFWSLSKRVANNTGNDGREQSGLAPAPSDTYIYIADRLGNRVVVVNAETNTQVRSFGSSGTGNGQLSGPRGIDVDIANDRVYVADTGNNRIMVFNTAGTYVAKWGGTAAGSGDLQFNAPRDVAVDTAGNVWITDTNNNRIKKHDKDGNFLLKRDGNTTYRLQSLEKINVSSSGQIYAATSSSTYPQGWYVLNDQGAIIYAGFGVLREMTSVGSTLTWVQGGGDAYTGKTLNGSLINGSTLCQSIIRSKDGTVWILESDATATSRVLKYNAAGVLSATISGWGTGSGQTRGATGFTVARGAARDAIAIAKELITDTNTVDGNSWIRPSSTIKTSSSIFINPGTWGGFKTVSDAIDELSGAFEWKVIPKKTTDGTGLVLGEFYADATLGADKSNLITFEFGTGKHNATGYSIKRSMEGLANRASYPAADATPYEVTVTDAAAASLNGVFEDVLSGSLIAEDLRRQVADLNVQIRKDPRMLVEVSPDRSDVSGPTNRRVAIPLLEYEPGDIVGLIVKDQPTDSTYRVPAAAARVYDITIEVDEQGKEEATLNLYLDS